MNPQVTTVSTRSGTAVHTVSAAAGAPDSGAAAAGAQVAAGNGVLYSCVMNTGLIIIG
jgi:hypothetical protein